MGQDRFNFHRAEKQHHPAPFSPSYQTQKESDGKALKDADCVVCAAETMHHFYPGNPTEAVLDKQA
jgi:hypothetical protein